MPRKSQITVFIVLGLVILIVFSFVFYLRYATSGVFLRWRGDRLYRSFMRKTSLRGHISDCFDTALKEAIVLVSLQGGKIYSSQANMGYNETSIYGFISFNCSGLYSVVNFSFCRVGYGVKAPNMSAPEYPYPGYLVEEPNKINSSYTQVFALKESNRQYYSLPFLCNKYGPNFPYIPNATFTCETNTENNDSIQDYIRYYLLDRVVSCVNFSRFASMVNYNISEGEPEVWVVIGDNDIFARLKYPIIVSIPGLLKMKRTEEFSIRKPIRLKKIHELAMHLIGSVFGRNIKTNWHKADANNIFFNITRDDPGDCGEDRNRPCILNGMHVKKLPDYYLNYLDKSYCSSFEHYCYSDLLIINDTLSRIDDRPLVFVFAIENRAPALDYIYWKYWRISGKQSHELCGYDYCSYIEDITGRNLALVYNKVGDYISTNYDDYDIVVCLNDTIEIYPMAIDPDEDIVNYEVYTSAPFSFKKTGQDNFTANASVTGEYFVVVNASDNEGLYDYQNVSVYVKMCP